MSEHQRVPPFDRKARQSDGQAYASLEPEGIREYLLNAPLSRGGRLWCDRILEGVDRGDRTDKRLFAETLRLVGGQVNIVNVLVERLGVGSEGELRRKVELGNAYERLGADRTDEEYFEAAMDMLAALVRKHPEMRTKAAHRLGAESHAVDISADTNGNGAETNGHAQG